MKALYPLSLEALCSQDVEMRKIIYFARRNIPSLAAWRARWRRHASLALSLPLWQAVPKYSQCDPIDDQGRSVRAGGVDGIGICWFRGAAGLVELHDPDGTQLLLADEQEAFGEFVGHFSIVTKEKVLLEGHGAPIKAFVPFRHSLLEVDRAMADCVDVIMNTASIASHIHRIALNTTQDDEYSQNGRIDYSGLLEISFASPKPAMQLRSLLKTHEPHEPHAVPAVSHEIIIAREQMIYDEAIGLSLDPLLIDGPPITTD
jgi:hypothetical protein